ncbi:hypothetical protein BS299_22600, partial [Mycobacterium tuberculosis M13]
PQVTSLPVEYYPAGRLNFVDTAADPTTCVSWEKASTDPPARTPVCCPRPQADCAPTARSG